MSPAPAPATMTHGLANDAAWSTAAIGRMAWTIGTLLVVQALVCGLSVLPVVLLWAPMVAWTAGNLTGRFVIFSLAVVPSYALFAVTLICVSALSTRLTGWRSCAGVIASGGCRCSAR